MAKTFLIVDVSNLAYRSSYAHKELQTSTGRFSGHIYGSASTLLSTFTREEFKGLDLTLCLCYDGKRAKDYRRTVMPEYKTNRIPHEFDPLPEVTELCRLIPGIHIMQEDKEGDDAMAYAVKMRQGQPCIVWSGDKDIWSLLQYTNVKVLSPNLKRFVEPSDIYQHYHLENKPERIYLAKALFGDASDGIKGVERLIKKQVEPILNADNVLMPEDFYQKLGNTKPDFVSDKMWVKLQENRDKVSKNYLVVLPQLDFKRESVTVVNKDSLPLLRQKLIDYECFSLLGLVN